MGDGCNTCMTVRRRQLRLGALIGSIAVSCVVFLFGFGGVLAAWSGLFEPSGPDDYGNTILFSLLDNVNGHRHTIIVVVVAVLCAPPEAERRRFAGSSPVDASCTNR